MTKKKSLKERKKRVLLSKQKTGKSQQGNLKRLSEPLRENDVLIFIGLFAKKFHQLPALEDVPAPRKYVERIVSQLVKDGYLEKGLIHGKRRSV